MRSYKFMLGGRVILAFGDIATQVAQYKIFSSWFPPNHGFAATLGLELGIGKIGSFVGKSTANIIAKKTGDFSWTFWTSVFMNLFTNFMTLIFYLFTRYANKKFAGNPDPATGEKLTEKNKKFEFKKVLELPWVFWCIMLFSLLETSTAMVFTGNATELAEQRFGTDSITAGWYTAVLQYAGFFLVPLLGIFIDLFGNRITIRKSNRPLQTCSLLTHTSSVCLWLRCDDLHVSGQLGQRHQGNSGLFRHLRLCLLPRSHRHHRWHSHFHVALIRLRIRLRRQDHHE